MVLTVLFWAYNFIAIKHFYGAIDHLVAPKTGISVPALALIRFFPMYAFLVAVCWMRGLSLRLRREDAVQVLFLGFCSMGLYMVFFLEGVRHLLPSDGAIIMATAPIITAFWAAGLKQERLRLGTLGGAILAFCGVVIANALAAERKPDHWVGFVCVVFASIVWGFSAVLTRKLLTNDRKPLQLLTQSLPGALVLLVPYGLSAATQVPYGDLKPFDWLMFAHISLLSGAAGYLGFYAGVEQIGAAGAMLYQYFVTPCVALFAYLQLHQELSLNQAIGGAVVITGVVWAQWARNRATPEPTPCPEAS